MTPAFSVCRESLFWKGNNMSDYKETSIKRISAEDFSELTRYGRNDITVLDLREPDEVLIHPIDGAINIPFSQVASRLDEVSSDKPVYVICRTGDFSEEITEILTDREYEAYNVDGGYDEFRNFGNRAGSTDTSSLIVKIDAKADPEEEIFIDAKNLRCPGPIVKVADTLRSLPDGSKVRVEATEDAFYSDIAVWCERTGNELQDLKFEDGIVKARIQKKSENTSKNDIGAVQVSNGNDKTFIVFSGDLDKTIASFIMANGAAALGRNVTMFFTFWGLNILRRPNKVKVAKTFIEKMFGIMLPRGTKKLGLSRMNMFGAGPKMIRAIMKSKGISSLEELIQDAISHGVRIVACQMSMDIMGIHKEELIDGVELGGVATFIGSGEKSDISLFI